MKTIYCDESGFTGNNLYSAEQPYFLYSSVAVEPEEAKYVVEKAIQDYKIDSAELKGSKIVKHRRGQQAALWILEQIGADASVMVADKMYALSAKFYEYAFEPVLAENNSLFYNVQFHRFISNLLYLHFASRATHTEEVLVSFETAMRAKRFDHIEQTLLTVNANPHLSQFLAHIATFCMHHKPTIVAELESLRNMPEIGNWVLELSMTCLHGLLASWGEKYDALTVYCDASKPLAAQVSFFNHMIGRTDRVYLDIAGNQQPIIYNLTGPIQLVDSKGFLGIQLADVFASAIAYSLKNRDEPFAKQCFALCKDKDIIHPNSMGPDFQYVNLEERYGFINALLLEELIKRTQAGEDLIDGIGQFITFHSYMYPQWRRQRLRAPERVKKKQRRRKKS